MTITVTFSNQMISPDIVRNLREKLGMTQAELADDAKVSEAEVKAYEEDEPTNLLLFTKLVRRCCDAEQFS
jgi:transcriptional regulator with XRE-family HTH domain